MAGATQKTHEISASKKVECSYFPGGCRGVSIPWMLEEQMPVYFGKLENYRSAFPVANEGHRHQK